MEYIGKDATEAFEDIGHSDEAREILEKYLVGVLDAEVIDKKFERFI
jgi:cytochrome b involved in lipid metabolism